VHQVESSVAFHVLDLASLRVVGAAMTGAAMTGAAMTGAGPYVMFFKNFVGLGVLHFVFLFFCCCFFIVFKILCG